METCVDLDQRGASELKSVDYRTWIVLVDGTHLYCFGNFSLDRSVLLEVYAGLRMVTDFGLFVMGIKLWLQSY